MYQTHFGLNQYPFSMTPDPSFFFAGNKRGEILEALIYAIGQGDGLVKVTGEVGCGKTMLCRMLETRLPAHIEIIYLVNPTLTSEQVVFALAGELELPVQGKRVDEVIRMLQAELISKHSSGKQVVLLIEEAQAMSLQTLEEIRLFSNLETAHHKLLQIVLFGQPELDEHLHLNSMRQLRERITNSFKVPALTNPTVTDYLEFRLHAAGYQGSGLFSREAVKLISLVSEGIIRRVSILADKSLLAAYSENSMTVKARHVRAAIADSEFPKAPLYRRRLQIAGAVLVILLAVTAGVLWRTARPAPQLAQVKATVPVAPKPAAAPIVVIQKTEPENKPTPEPPIKPMVESVPRATTLQQRLDQTSAFLDQQAPDRFSVQIALITSGDQAVVAQYLGKLEAATGLQDLYIYSSHKTANPCFGIFVGSYATRDEAGKMLKQLSDQWGYHPQLRTIGGIKKEI
ncbi:MSHA biogenesis protein MshM [Oxalobacteraceae bacterium GrIS 1.18]